MNRSQSNDPVLSALFGAGLGLALGALLGLIFAPRPGGETRRMLADRLRLWRSRELGRLAHLREQAEARRAHSA